MLFSFHNSRLTYKLITVVILLIAFALRVVAIDRIPAGLSHDEAYNGVAALQVLDGQWPIFFEINKGIEPLIIYLEALAFYFFGVGPVQLRLVNIGAGMLTVALVYPLAARLFNRQVALLALAGLAVSFWAIFVSRLTLRAVLLPPLLLLTLYFFWRALAPAPQITRPRTGAILSNFTLAGLFAGVTMYTYLSSRFLPFILLLLFGYQLLGGHLRRVHWLGLLICLSLWGLIFVPLGLYFWENADSFTRRSDQVTTIPHLLNGEIGPTLTNTLRTLGMFTFTGDTTARYNLDGRPVFDWLNGLLFYLGFGILLWRLVKTPLRAPVSVLLLSSGFFMLVPDFITDDSPHFLRTIGALPIVYVLWAIGLDTAIRLLGQWVRPGQPSNLPASQSFSQLTNHQPHSPPNYSPTHPTNHLANPPTIDPTHPPTNHPSIQPTNQPSIHPSFLPALPLVLVILLLSLTTFHTGYDYFVRWSTAPEARHIYGADIAAVARYLNQSGSVDLPAISAVYYRDLDRFRLKLHFGGQPPFAIWFDGRQSLAFPPPDSDLSPRYIFPDSAPAPDLWTSFLQPAASQSGPEYRVYRLPDQAVWQQWQAQRQPVAVTINDDLILQGYRVLDDVITGGQFRLLLFWQALRALPPGTDYTFVVQMRDLQGRVWLQTDGSGYDPGDWQPGILGLQLLTFHLPGDLSPRTYQLVLQVINRHTGQPLPTAAGQTELLLGPVQARLAPTPRTMYPDRLPNPRPPDASAGGAATGLSLRGYALSQRSLHSGDELEITMHWQVRRQPAEDYRLVFFLLDSDGAAKYRWPALAPIGGEWPTGRWPAEYWVQDKQTLSIGPDLPAGQFELRGTWVPNANLTTAELLRHSFSLDQLQIE